MMMSICLVGCGVGEGTGSTPPWAKSETPTAPALESDQSDSQSKAAAVEVIDPYRVRMQTTKGDVVIAVHPEWAPRGAVRFKELVESGYFDDMRIFRVVPGFVVQFGMHGDPEINAEWDKKVIPDDPVVESNKRGRVTFATSGAHARTSQIFINLSDNPNLDTMYQSFAPFGEVVEGMEVVDAINSEYGERPQQERIMQEGNAYLDAEFPRLDSIIQATVIEEDASAGEGADGEDSPAASDEAAAE